ncbi:hypothetical protein [Bosea thiooxidans]
MPAHIARIAPIDAIHVGKMLLTLTALDIRGENKAAACAQQETRLDRDEGDARQKRAA